MSATTSTIHRAIAPVFLISARARATARPIHRRPPGSEQFTGVDNTFIADAVYKWAPNGNFAQSYVKLQGEAFARKESGAFTALNFATAPGTATTRSFNSGIQTGFYAQAVYQFIPFWRVGVRYDQVHAPSLGLAFAGTTINSRD